MDMDCRNNKDGVCQCEEIELEWYDAGPTVEIRCAKYDKLKMPGNAELMKIFDEGEIHGIDG